MTNQLSLQWLASADDAAIKANIDAAASVVVAFRKQASDADDAWITRAVQRVLRLCADTGAGSVAPDHARQLLFPILLYLHDADRKHEFATELTAIARRSDVRSSEALDQHLAPFAPSEHDRPAMPAASEPLPLTDQAESSGDIACGDLAKGFADGVVPSLGAAPPAQELAIASEEWDAIRKRVDDDRRAIVDVWLLRASMLRHAALAVPYVEALAGDEPFWLSEAAQGFVDGLVEPFRREVVGYVQSALLNSRLRGLRPRLFLRAPESLVIEPIGVRLDVGRIEEELTDELSAPLLRAIATIDAENTRAASRPPRKKVFKELGGYLEQVLERLGSALEGHVGATEKFDPTRHVAAEEIEVGHRVEIVVPGLRDRLTRRIRIKALVQLGSGTVSGGHGDVVQPDETAPAAEDGRSGRPAPVDPAELGQDTTVRPRRAETS